MQRSVHIIRVDADISVIPYDFSYITRRSEALSRQVVQVVDHSSVRRWVIKLVPLFRNDAYDQERQMKADGVAQTATGQFYSLVIYGVPTTTQLSCLADVIATQALRVCLPSTRSFWFVTFAWSD